MLTREENERLTRVGPGTPGGEMLRRYWWPVTFGDEIGTAPYKVRVLGEDFILFRDGQGRVGAVETQCAHRGAALEYGRVEACGLRCCYHGWLYDVEGRCLEQPEEPEDSTFKDRIRLRALPVQEAAGLVFVYLGPEPAPLLPRYDLMYRTDGVRTLWSFVDHCNWLQCAENTVDQAHLAWLHASIYPSMAGKRLSIDWEQTGYGVRALSRVPGLGAPKVSCTIFPCHNRFTSARTVDVGQHRAAGPRHNLLYRTPIDDHQTRNLFVMFTPTADGEFQQYNDGFKPTTRGVYEREPDGWWGVATDDQDRMGQEGQGLVANRTREHLGHSDRGIVLLRTILRASIEAVEQGRDPFGVVRDPAANAIVEFDASMDELQALV